MATDINKALGIFAKMTPEQQAAARKKKGVMEAFKSAGASLPTTQTKTTQSAPTYKAPIDMNVGENIGGISGDSASLYGFGTRKPTTVATPENPVKEISVGTVGTAYDPNDPQDYIWRMNAKIAAGQTPTQEEYYNIQKANAAISSPKGDPEAMITSELEQRQAELDELRAKKDKDDAELIRQKEIELKNKYDILRAEQEKSAQREKTVTQQSTSFSGFGRSTFSADQQVEIQKRADRALEALTAKEQLELEAYRMELEGAEPESIATVKARINELNDTATALKQQAIENAANISAQQGATMEQTVANLMSAASASGMDTKTAEQNAAAMRGMTPEQQAAFLSNFAEDEQLLLIGLSNATSGEAPKIQQIGKNQYGYFNEQGELVRIGGGGGGTAASTGAMTQADAYNVTNEIKSAISQIRDKVNKSYVRGSALLDPDTSNLKDFVTANMTIEAFKALKASGASMGAMSDSEWKILGDTIGSINAGMSKTAINEALDRVERKLGTIPSGQQAPATQQEEQMMTPAVPGADASDEDILAYLNG